MSITNQNLQCTTRIIKLKYVAVPSNGFVGKPFLSSNVYKIA